MSAPPEEADSPPTRGGQECLPTPGETGRNACPPEWLRVNHPPVPVVQGGMVRLDGGMDAVVEQSLPFHPLKSRRYRMPRVLGLIVDGLNQIDKPVRVPPAGQRTGD